MGRKDKWVLQLKKTKDTISTLNCEHPLVVIHYISIIYN